MTVGAWLDQVHGHGVLRVGVVVEASAGLAAVESGLDHALEERRRGEASLAELVEHDLGDVVGRVEPDEVEERERPHRVAAAELHAVVYVHDGADALFERAYRVEQVWDEQAVDDEARAVVGADGNLAQLAAELDGRLVDLRVRQDGSDDLDELHHGHGVEEVQADEARLTLGPRGRHHLCYGERGGVRREYGLGLADGVELVVRVALGLVVLDDGLDDYVAVGEVFERGGAAYAPAHLRLLLGCYRPLLSELRERLVDAFEAALAKLVRDLAHDDFAPGAGGRLRYP